MSRCGMRERERRRWEGGMYTVGMVERWDVNLEGGREGNKGKGRVLAAVECLQSFVLNIWLVDTFSPLTS